jgi:hypothetical protein
MAGLESCVIEHGTVSEMRALQFFVSWNGVLCLVFKGFPRPLECLKRAIKDRCAPIPPENPGSRWPKISLAAVRPNLRLTPDQLDRVLLICEQFKQQLGETKVVVDDLTYAQYSTRCATHRTKRWFLSCSPFVKVQINLNTPLCNWWYSKLKYCLPCKSNIRMLRAYCLKYTPKQALAHMLSFSPPPPTRPECLPVIKLVSM